MAERVNSVDDAGIITAKDGCKYLCSLVHVAESEKRTMGQHVNFSGEERDKLLGDALKNLCRSNLIPDFYYEKWPVNGPNGYGADCAPPPFIHLTIQFYQKISLIKCI